MDRLAALVVVTTGELLRAADVDPEGTDRPWLDERMGLVLGISGTTRNAMSFTLEALSGGRPYFVNPVKFPKTVLNFAAGQCAIQYRLKGPNTTVVGGHLTGLLALQHAQQLCQLGHAEMVIWGSAEDASLEHVSLEDAAHGPEFPRSRAEGCAMFLLETEWASRREPRRPVVQVLGCQFGAYSEEVTMADTLANCISRTLSRAGAEARAVEQVMLLGGEYGVPERAAVASVLGRNHNEMTVSDMVGDTGSATASFQVASIMARADAGVGHGRLALVTSIDASGQAGCVLLRPVNRAG